MVFCQCEQVVAAVERCNTDPTVHGIIVCPLPPTVHGIVFFYTRSCVMSMWVYYYLLSIVSFIQTFSYNVGMAL